MRSKTWLLGSVMALSLMISQSAFAQEGFAVNYMDVGPVIGLGDNGGGISIGGRFEKGMKQVGEKGIFGLQIGADYWSYDFDEFNVLGGDDSVSVFDVAVLGTYHFVLDNKKIDPFLGVGLVYSKISFDFNCGGLCELDNSDIELAARAGLRYFFAPRKALYFDAGAGASALSIGVMFGFGGN